MSNVIELKDVSFGYNKELILKNINLNIPKGAFIGIIGTNGSGKSTLLKLILGIEKPQSGSIIKTSDLKIGYINQTTTSEDGGFPGSVFEVVSLGLKKKPMHFLTKKDKEKVLSILELFSLKELKNKSMSSLSGGQEQKVKIAKVFLSNPDLIIFDEPTTGIDQKSQEVLLELIDHLHAQKKTILLVSHKKEELERVDKVYEVIDGGIIDASI